MKKIKVIISEDGQHRHIEAEGYSGPLCADIIKRLSDRMGGVVIGDKHKEEYYQSESEELQEDNNA